MGRQGSDLDFCGRDCHIHSPHLHFPLPRTPPPLHPARLLRLKAGEAAVHREAGHDGPLLRRAACPAALLPFPLGPCQAGIAGEGGGAEVGLLPPGAMDERAGEGEVEVCVATGHPHLHKGIRFHQKALSRLWKNARETQLEVKPEVKPEVKTELKPA